jgi:acetyltransferase-like isoleucine patch superfamily enzyme
VVWKEKKRRGVGMIKWEIVGEKGDKSMVISRREQDPRDDRTDLNAGHYGANGHNLNFKSIGRGVMISRHASIYYPENITIGDNVRIDDFCVLVGSAGLTIGSHVHLAVYNAVHASSAPITIGDFGGYGARCLWLTATDDFTGISLHGPIVPDKYKVMTTGPIITELYTHMGTNCVVMPGVTLHEGAAVGAFSFVNRDCFSYSLYAGIPAKFRRAINRDVMPRMAAEFLEEWEGSIA